MLPTREEAEKILKEGELCNPGPWGDHSRNVALCAERIARKCGMDAEKAYILGLLHDMGRKFGFSYLRHVSDGYSYLLSLGYEEAARICMTHSFNNQLVEDYIGENDVTEAEYSLIQTVLQSVTYDDYDRLIQLCDSLAMATGIVDIEERMNDVKRRYGYFPQLKWDKNLELLHYFEEKTGMSIYEVVKE